MNIEALIKENILLQQQLDDYKGLFETIDIPIIIIDESGTYLDYNRVYYNLMGYTDKSELINYHPANVSPKFQPDGLESFSKANDMIQMALEKGKHSFEWMHKRPDGKEFLSYVTLDAIDYNQKKCIRAVINDISERKKLERVVKEKTKKIEEQTKKLLKAQHISKMGFWELNLTNNQLYWSDEIYNIFEIDKSEFKASYDGFLNVIHPDDRGLVNEAYSNSLKTKENYSIEHRLLMDDGRIKWVREECNIEFDVDRNPLISVGVVIDITELHLTQQKLIEQAYADDLTKLNNRKSYTENIQKLLSQYKRYQTPFSIIMYDIDNFKQINDVYGHIIGDNVLIEMSQLIKSHLRESDYIFRIGGEEFIILLTKTQINKAKLVSEKIRNSVENNLNTIKDKKITISIGLTEVEENDTEDSIFQRVDSLMYESKNSGKNRVTSE
ncbi:MAG: diguanylate cyclase [Campylobacterota bacterium]|nr:diguanylate cyclase [Campylobacterota bacterium]